MSDEGQKVRRAGDRNTAGGRVYAYWTNGVGAFIARSLVVVQTALVAVGLFVLNEVYTFGKEWASTMQSDMKELRQDVQAGFETDRAVMTEIKVDVATLKGRMDEKE